MGDVLIYGLIDPRSNELRYVGKTIKSAAVRCCGHIVAAKKAAHKRPVEAWIFGLLGDGLRPAIEMLETVADGEDWIEAERFWISYFRFLGARLTNLSPGGDRWTGRKMTPEARSRRKWLRGKDHPRFGVKDRAEQLVLKSQRAKALWADPVMAAKMTKLISEGQRKPEAVARVSARMKRLYADPVWRAAHEAKLLKARQSPRSREKVGIASRANWAANRDMIVAAQNAGKGDAFRAKQSASHTLLWQDVGHRRRMSVAHMRKLSSDDVREIRLRVANGEGQKAVAKSFGINQSHVSRIVSGGTLKHVA